MNFSENVLSDYGSQHFFQQISNSNSLLNIQIDLSSNILKFEGAVHIANAITFLSNRAKRMQEEYDADLEKQRLDEVIANQRSRSAKRFDHDPDSGIPEHDEDEHAHPSAPQSG